MIIDNDLIRRDIELGSKLSADGILEKAESGNGLTALETSALFQNLDDINQALNIAAKLKSKKKGDVATLYTCLYITNDCVNDCGYCGFRESNSDLERITLTSTEIEDEARAIRDAGVTNVILIGGTIPEEQYKCLIIDGTRNLRYLALNPWIEFENLSPETLREIQEAGADHFVLFQETYDRSRYGRLHSRNSLKRDYDARLRKVDEAFEAGFTNINIGALLGLNADYASEIVGLYNHAKRLQQKGAKVCISIPTLKPAPRLSIPPHKVSDVDVEKAYTVLRLALPDISLALSGREESQLRNRLFSVVDQIGTGGVTNPGGRTIYRNEYEKGDAQFTLYDTRSPKEIKSYLENIGIKIMPLVKWGGRIKQK